MFSVQANFVEDENHVLYISLSIYDNVRKNISINNIMITQKITIWLFVQIFKSRLPDKISQICTYIQPLTIEKNLLHV